MTVFIGASDGTRKTLTDPVVGTASGNKSVQKIWLGTASGNQLVYTRAAPVTLTATAVSASQIDVRWNDCGPGLTYLVTRNGAAIYNGAWGPLLSDTGLAASTTYNYVVQAISAGVVLSQASASASTQARPLAQKTFEAFRTSYASYNGSGGHRAPDDGYLYSGYYSGTQGNQKSSANFAIPADVLGCVSIDSLAISAYNVHAYSSNGRNVQLAVNHYSDAGAGSGSTGTAVELHANKPGWVGDAEWTEVRNYVCPGRTTIGEEFRVNGARGFTFNPGPSNNQYYYGYIRNDVRIRIVYTVML